MRSGTRARAGRRSRPAVLGGALYAVAALVVVGCSGSGGDGRTSAAASPATTTSTTSVVGGPIPGANACLPEHATGVPVAWNELRNPIVSTDAMAKDQAVVFADGRWYMLFSSRSDDPQYAGMGEVASEDLRGWQPVASRPDHGGSPDVTRLADGRYVVTYQHATSDAPDASRIYARVVNSLEELTAAEPVALFPELFPGERLIDGALAHTNDGLYAIFKRGAHTALDQHTEIAYSPSGGLEGPWELVGTPDIGWFENYQFIPIDGTWYLLGTRIPRHEPELYRLDGDPSRPSSWLSWTPIGTLEVPEEAWNSGGRAPGIDYERANSAYLCDARAADGHFYLFYAGSTELTTNDGRGHAQIGVARSKDLEHWRVPPGR